MAWDLWKDRNNIKHHTPTAAKQREMAKLDAEIDELRSISTDEICGFDAVHLCLTVEAQRNMNHDQKRRWIAKAEAIRVAHANVNIHPEHPTIAAAANTQPLTTWFSSP